MIKKKIEPIKEKIKVKVRDKDALINSERLIELSTKMVEFFEEEELSVGEALFLVDSTLQNLKLAVKVGGLKSLNENASEKINSSQIVEEMQRMVR